MEQAVLCFTYSHVSFLFFVCFFPGVLFDMNNLSLNIYFMYNINIFEHIQDMCLLHYNIIQWDSEESQQTYEVRLPFFANMNVQIQHVT